jgi:serine/threonine protein kinase
VFLLQQVCHSLGEAHARGLIHRDIKPANIFVCRLGPDDDFVKVLDFGLVKHFDAASTLLTLDGMATGTPAYMAPEVALGRPDVDGRADLYSVGCVAYYLLTGRHVFQRKSIVETVLAHVNSEPQRPSAVSEVEMPQALELLILECLAKDPAARPPSTAVLSDRLAEALPSNPWTPEAAHAWWDLHGVPRATAQQPARCDPSTVRPRIRFLPSPDTISTGVQIG